MKVEMILEKTNTGFSAYAVNHPIYTVGSNLKDLKKNMLEAANLYFEKDNIKIRKKDLIIEC